MKKARYYKKLKDNKVQCHLCPHQCLITEGNQGICRARINEGGDLYSDNYGKISSTGIDPIEKKPLYHFYPGEDILSLGTFGCNFSCGFCQNWRISQKKPGIKEFTPEEIVDLAESKDVCGIAYTYSEPLVWFEFVLETSKLAAERNIKNVLVTNGYINKEPLEELLPYIDGANIDIKSFSPEFYEDYPGGTLEPVLRNVKKMYQEIHIELTNLLISDINDSKEDLNDLFSWIKDIDPEVPLHLSRYFPNYKFDKEQTSIQTMKKAYKIARKYLDFVYIGNIRLEKGNNTICPECGETLIKRNFYNSQSYLKENECPICGKEIYGEF